MNYLAHLYLAGESDDSRLGNILGDFVKGNAAGRYPPAILRGIMMHRKVDRFADHHPQSRSARQLISPARRRFAGVIVDICYDHFLSVHWKYLPVGGWMRSSNNPMNF